MKLEASKIALVAAPTLIGLGLFGLSFAQRNRFVEDGDKRQKVEAQISTLYQTIATETAKPSGRQASVPEVQGEESAYLTFIRSIGQSLSVKIIRWSANPRGVPGQIGSQKIPNPSLMDVTPLSGSLEISGSYRAVLSFVRQLETADRLYNLSTVNWSRPDNGFDVHFRCIVTRFVTPPPAPSQAGAPVSSVPAQKP